MSKISSSKKKSSLKNIQVEKQITIDNVIINTIFISIIYNIFVLGYILNLEGKHFNPKLMQFQTTSENEAQEYFWKSMIVGKTHSCPL